MTNAGVPPVQSSFVETITSGGSFWGIVIFALILFIIDKTTSSYTTKEEKYKPCCM